MARPRKPQFETETVEAIASGVAEDLDSEHGPDGGYWHVKEGSIWESSARIVELQPAWFCELGRGRTSPSYFPEREPSS